MKVKAQKLRKRLLLEFAVAAVVLMVAGGGAYLIDEMHTDYQSRKTGLEGQVSAVTNETNALREKYIRIQNNIDLYQKVMEMTNADTLSSNIDIADARMWDYKKNMSFSKLALKYGDPKALEDSKYKRATTVIGVRNSVISFEGALDEDVFELVRALARDFPGAVVVTQLVIKRESPLTDDALRTLSRTGQYKLMSGQIGFMWMGMQSSDPEVAKKAATRGRRR